MGLERLNEVRPTLSAVEEVTEHPRHRLNDRPLKRIQAVIEWHLADDLQIVTKSELRSVDAVGPLGIQHAAIAGKLWANFVEVFPDFFFVDLVGWDGRYQRAVAVLRRKLRYVSKINL